MINIERVVLTRELIRAILPSLLSLGSSVLVHHLLIIVILSSGFYYNLFLWVTLVINIIFKIVSFLMGLELEQTPRRVVIDVHVELLLFMELLHGGSVNTNDISDVRDHWEIFLSLGVDDNRCINRSKGVSASSVVKSVIYNFQSANVFSLIRAIREPSIDNYSEKVVMIILGVQIRLFEWSVNILTLQTYIKT